MARGNYHHHKRTCPICSKRCDAGMAFVSHMRMHTRRGEAVELVEPDILGKWVRSFRVLATGKEVCA